MKYVSYEPVDCLNGYGYRVVIWLSFCSHGCKGCFSKSTWGDGGTEVDQEMVDRIMADLNKPFIKGITFSGGDPLHKRNYKDVQILCEKIKKELPEKDIWVYTGYTYEQVLNDLLRSPILTTIDYLMDGRYECDNPTDKPYRGSHNQVLHRLENGISVEQL